MSFTYPNHVGKRLAPSGSDCILVLTTSAGKQTVHETRPVTAPASSSLKAPNPFAYFILVFISKNHQNLEQLACMKIDEEKNAITRHISNQYSSKSGIQFLQSDSSSHFKNL